MVAIVTGKGAGLGAGSASILGANGLLGSAATGRSEDKVVVNAATGNLVVTGTDEMLTGRGPDAAISRTYNSLGAWDGDNDDYWRAGVYRRVTGLSGTYGAAATTVKRTDWDGSEVTYGWNANYFSAGVGAYVATDGAGAHDILVKSGSVWTWTDGDAGITESYDDSNSGRITARTDRDGNAVAYAYTGTLLTQVTTADGGYTSLVYGGTAGNQLQSVITYAPGASASYTRIFYEYDSAASTGRLSKVLVNLTPADNSKATGANYETTYTYDGTSKRVASIGQSDGTLVQFGYTLVGADYRVTSIVEAVAAGVTRATGFVYDTTNRITTIVDAAGQVTRLGYDANGNLLKITAPPTLSGGPLITEFTYDADGNVTARKTGPGTTVYGYDAHGNVTSERDTAGNTVTRTYNISATGRNEQLTETRYLVPDPDGAGAGAASSPLTTNYVYDAKGHVRFAVSPAGTVTEYRYDGWGQQVSKIEYTGSTYASTMTEAALSGWVSAMTDRSGSQRTDTWYDFRGNVSRTVTYAALDVFGEGTQDPQAVFAGLNATVAQQADGTYRVTKTSGAAGWNTDAHSTVKAEGDFVLQVRPNQSATQIAVGVSSSQTGAGFGTISEGLYFDPNGVAYRLNSSSYTALPATGYTNYVAGESLWMVRTGSTITYYKGATLSAAMTAGAIRTVTGMTGTLYLDADLYAVGASADIGFTPQPIANGANTSVVQQPDGLYRITKTAGANVYDADARGSAAATGDFVLQVRPGQTNADMVAGVATAPGTSSNSTDINYGFGFSDSGALLYQEGGTSSSLGGTYAATDNFWLVRVGSTVSYYRGATLEQAVAAGALRTVTGVTSTLYFDSALRVVGSKADVRFTPGALSTPEISRTDYVYDPSGRLLSRAVAGQGAERYVYDGLGRITTSTDFNNVVTSIAYTDATASTTTVTLASGLVQTSTYDRAGELISYAESGSGMTTATTTYGYDILGRLRSTATPTGETSYILRDALGRKTADIDADGSMTEYRYDASGNLSSTTAYANKLSAAQLATLLRPGAAIVVGTNTSVAQQSDGLYRITKTAGGTPWTADARGAVAATGDFILEVKPAQNNQPLIAGVSTAPATSSGNGEIAYGIYLDFGNIYNWPAGTSINYGTYSAGDHIWMARVGNTISYYKGASFAAATAAGALGTVGGVSTATMYFDSTLYTVGSAMDVGFTAFDGIDALRPAADSANDRWNWLFYDVANRVTRGIDGTGAVTAYAYDGASQLVSTTAMATRMSASDITALKAAAIGGNLYTNQNVSTFWSLANVTIAANGTINGVNAFKVTTVTTGQQAIAGGYNQQQLVNAGDMVSYTVTIRAETMNSATVGILSTVSGMGNNADATYEILSGPGTMSYQAGASFQFTGLSTTVATTVRITRTFYATEYSAGRVCVGINPLGQTAGDSLTISNPIVTQTPPLPAFPATDAANDRVTRVFYDNAGQIVGSLDGEGYLTQTVYDSAGRKIRTIAYSGATSTTYRASGTFAQLLGSVTLDAAKDIRNYWLYDARGLLRASIDGEGMVTRYDYSPAGYLARQSSGQKLDPATIAATPPTFATLAAPGGSEVIAETLWTRNLYGQPLTESRLLTGSTYTTTSYSYDSNRKLVSTVAQSGVDPRTYSQRYDRQGRLISELDAVGNAALAALGGSPTQAQIDNIYIDYGTSYTYDAAGRLTSKSGPRGTASGAVAPKTIYYYTADGDLAYQINSWSTRNPSPPYDTVSYGEMVEYRYNAFGERTDMIVYSGRMSPSTLSTLSGGLATSAIDSTIHAQLHAGLDSVTHTDFNVDGSVKQSTDPLSNVTTYAYNAFGELITDIMPRDGSATIQTSRTYDRRGLLKQEIVDSASGGKAITTSYGYDAFGRTLTLTNANSKVTTNTYDRKGRVATSKDALNNTTTYTYDARDNLVAVTDARSNVTRYVYDKANRRIATIDAMGGVVTTAYWPDGQVKFTTEYATRISLSGLPLEVTQAVFIAPSTNAADRTTTYTYDKDGQLRFTIDGLNHVVEVVHDTGGHAIRTIAYDGTISSFTPGSVTTDWVASQVASLASAPGNRVTRAIYDANGRVNYSIDASGQVTWSYYDGTGLLFRRTEFAATYSAAGDPLMADMDAWRLANANAANDRSVRTIYDNKGQLGYTIDALGYVTRLEYDKLGNVKAQTRYAEVYTGTVSLDALNTYYATPPATSRITEFNYDSAGRLEETLVTIQLSPSVIKTSTKLVLDQMGHILSSTEAYGTADASTTAYTYDDVGRVTSQTRGSGTAEASTTYFFYDAVGNNVATVDGDKYLAVSVFDALGKTTTNTRYAGAITGSFTTASTVAALQALAGTSAYDLTVSATYDRFGRAVTTTDARGSVVSLSYDILNRLTSQTEQLETGTGDDRTTSYTYNNFGELAKTHDARGNDSFAWYDLLGRVTREVDAERYVTDTSYSRGGQVASVKRYDAAIGAGVTISETSKPDPLGGATFSLTGFTYDRRDMLTATTDAMGFTESYTLNAFGERVQMRNKLHGSVVNGVTLDTTVYYTYDGRGLMLSETLPISTKNSGGTTISVVNSYSYDLRGNVLTKVEAAGAVEARTTTYSYDKLDRVTQAAGDAVTIVNDDLTSTTGVVPTETYKYDRRGNIIESKDLGGARTLTWYDFAGNAVAQVVQTDKVSGVDKGVLTRNSFDGNGSVVSTWTYGDLITVPANANGSIPTAVDTNNYRLTSFTYYRDNRLKETKIVGITSGEWTGSAFVVTAGMVSGAPNAAADIKTLVEYDAAGNVTHQEDGRGNDVYMWYDKLGCMVAKVDAESYLTVWTRDAEGNALTETRFATKLASFTPGSATPPTGTSNAADRITNFIYDRNGRRIEEKRLGVAYTAITAAGAATDVAATDSTAFSKVNYTYNGLGQVLTKIEANLADISVSTTARDTTTYSYDTIGRLTLELDQSFVDYQGATVTPRTAYTYDGLNNLKTMRVQLAATANDTDDRITTYVYGAGGRLSSMTDAAGKTHDYGYDIAGRMVRDSYTRAKSDATTVVEAAVTRYDFAGRATLQTFARLGSGSVWKFTVSDVGGAAYYDATRMRYDAFGEVTGRGITGGTAGPNDAAVYQETFDYDSGGRVWRSNAGDGVLRFYVYDKAGNQTLTLASAGADLSSRTAADYTALIGSTGAIAASGSITAANAVTTVTVYDKRNQATFQREPGRQLTSGTSALIVSAATYNAFGETASTTDARGFDASGNAISFSGGAGYTTLYTYNTMGRLLSKISPQVAATSEAGVTTNVNPTEYYGYDLGGRLVSTRDANNNRTTRQLLAGTGHDGKDALVRREFHPDTGIAETKYDVFGNARILRNELYNPSSPNATFTDEVQTFDKMGRLSSVVHRGGVLTDSYTYDMLGQQLTNTETWLVGGSPVSVTAKTDYDAQQRIVRQESFGGDVTTMTVSWNSTMVATDIAGAAVASAGGWVTTVTSPNTAKTTSKSEDRFGHAISSTDMSGTVTNYRYDRAGRMARRTISTDTYNYSYYNGGGLAQTGYTNGVPGTSTPYDLWTESYTYDSVGNQLTDVLTKETGYWQDYGHYEYYYGYEGYGQIWVVDGQTFEITTDTIQSLSTTYDALNRIVTYDAAATNTTPVSSIHYYYDANSNVRRSYATYRNLDQYGYVITTVPPAQDYWYRYDSMNRVLTAKGMQSGSTVVRGTTGTDYSYNGASQRVTAINSFSGTATVTVGDPYDPYYGSYTSYVPYDGDHIETYTYTADSQVATVRIAETSWYDNGDGTITVTPPPSTGALKSNFTYDARGRLSRQLDYLYDGDYNSTAAYDRQVTYNSQGQVYYDIVNQRQGADTLVTTTYNYYTDGGGYALGSVTSASSSTTKNGSWYSSSTTTNTYNWRDGTAIASANIVSSVSGGSSTNYTTYYTYTVSGTLTSAYIADGQPRNVVYTNDTGGQVIRRDEGYAAPHEVWYRFGGRQLGYTGNNGTLETDYQASINSRTATPGNGLFQGGSSYSTPNANFDQSLAPINSYSQGGGSGSYSAKGGETLSGIAAQLWGDSGLWYKLAEANGLSGSSVLAPGQVISIPGGVMRSTNSASTFQPYDANAAMGDTSPTTPAPPTPQKAKKKGCGVLGMILLAVIAIAVAAVTAGAAIAAATPGLSLGGGITAALGGAVSVGVGAAAVPVAGLVGTFGLAGGLAIAAGAAALGSIVSQGFGVATGLQDKFSWKAVGLAAIGGAVGAGIGPGGVFGKGGLFGTGVAGGAKGLLGTVSSNVVRAGLNGVAGSIINQGLGVATRLQKKFSFVGVAAAGVGAMAGYAVGDKLGATSITDDNTVGNYAANFAASGASMLANAATRSVLEGSDFGDNIMAALPDVIAQTLGDLIFNGVSGPEPEEDDIVIMAAMATPGATPAPCATPSALAAQDTTPPASDEIVVTADRDLYLKLKAMTPAQYATWLKTHPDPNAYVAPELGSLSAQYESRGGVGTVSDGVGDDGGPSYGSYQMSSQDVVTKRGRRVVINGGTVKRFLASDEGKPYREEFRGLRPGSADFTAKWKAIALREPTTFHQAQFNYIKSTHYDPAVAGVLAATDFDLDSRSEAVRNATWSVAVQHHSAVSQVLIPAIRDMDALKIPRDDPNYDRILLEKIYGERSSYIARQIPAKERAVQRTRPGTPEHRVAVRALTSFQKIITVRYRNELRDAKKMLQEQVDAGAWPPPKPK